MRRTHIEQKESALPPKADMRVDMHRLRLRANSGHSDPEPELQSHKKMDKCEDGEKYNEWDVCTSQRMDGLRTGARPLVYSERSHSDQSCSKPLVLRTAAAFGDVRNCISAFAAAGSFACDGTDAVKTV
jgi:hypothetical protein